MLSDHATRRDSVLWPEGVGPEGALLHYSFVSSKGSFGTLVIIGLLQGAFFDISIIIFLISFCGCCATIVLYIRLVLLLHCLLLFSSCGTLDEIVWWLLAATCGRPFLSVWGTLMIYFSSCKLSNNPTKPFFMALETSSSFFCFLMKSLWEIFYPAEHPVIIIITRWVIFLRAKYFIVTTSSWFTGGY